MIRLFPLLLLVLLTAACNVQDGTISHFPLASPTGQQEAILATPVLQSKDATGAGNGAFLMGETSAVDTVDHAATKMVYVDRIATAEAENVILAQALAAQNTEAERLKLDTQKSVEQTAKYNAANSASAAAQDAEKTAKTLADAELLAQQNKALELRVLELQAQAAVADATTKQFVAFLVAALGICGALLVVSRRMRTPREVEPVEAEPPTHDPYPELQKLNRPIIPISDTTLDTDTNPPGNIDKFRAYVDYALQGWALGQNSVVKAKIYGSHPEYKEVLTWMRKKRYTSEQNGQIGLSDKGKRDLKLWSYDFNPPIR